MALFFYVASEVVPDICRDIYTTGVMEVAHARHKRYLKLSALNISRAKLHLSLWLHVFASPEAAKGTVDGCFGWRYSKARSKDGCVVEGCKC